MTVVRVVIECDIEVTDEAVAKEVLRRFAVEFVDDATLSGKTINSGANTPHDVIENLMDTSMVHVALALESLKCGSQSMPMTYTVVGARAVD